MTARKTLRYLLSTLVFFSAFQFTYGQGSIDFAKGLVAYYPYHNKQLSSLKDRQVSPTLLSEATFTANRFGDGTSALQFDGNRQSAQIAFSEALSIDRQDGYALSFWIQPRDDNSGCILLKEGDFGVKWNGFRSPLSVFDGIENGFPTGNFSEWSSDSWYHIVLNKVPGKLSLYINGRQDKTWEIKSKEGFADKPIFIGKHPYFWGGFEGNFDDLALYDRPLNKYEILTLSQIENIPLESYVEQEEQTVELRSFLGTWNGVITQPGNEQIPNYVFSLYFNKIEGGLLKGYSRIEVPEEDAFGVTRIQAWLSGNSLNFEEIQVYRQKNYLGYKWCKKYGQLRLTSEVEQLRGQWLANNCADNGELILSTSQVKFNFYDNRLSAKIPYEEFLQKLREGQADGPIQLELEPIAFGFGNAILTEKDKEYLKSNLVSLLTQYPQYNLAVNGYTDAVGKDEYNLFLSTSRAKAIYEFLIQAGVNLEQLSYQGMGEANPIDSNATAEGRAANRRVEFILSKK